MAAGLAHELNNPAAAARRAAAQMAEALEVVELDDRAGSWSRASSASDAEAARRAAPGGDRARRSVRPRSARSMPPTPRTSCSTRLEELGVPEAWKLVEPLARRRPRRGLARPCRRGRRAGDRRRARLGRRDAHRAGPGRRAQGVDGSHVEPRRRGQVVRVHGPRRPRRDRPSRGHRDDDRDPRTQARADGDRDQARLRPLASPS